MKDEYHRHGFTGRSLNYHGLVSIAPSVKPIYEHDHDRIVELRNGIRHFLEISEPLPTEWVDEYNHLSGMYSSTEEASK